MPINNMEIMKTKYLRKKVLKTKQKIQNYETIFAKDEKECIIKL